MTQLSMEARHPQLFRFHFKNVLLLASLLFPQSWCSLQWYSLGYFTALKATMSSFEPNAVIRGFQLTVVGSMSPYMFCFYFPAIQGDWFKMPRIPGYTRNSINVSRAV